MGLDITTISTVSIPDHSLERKKLRALRTALIEYGIRPELKVVSISTCTRACACRKNLLPCGRRLWQAEPTYGEGLTRGTAAVVSSLSDLLYQGISTYMIAATGARALIGNNLLKDLPRVNNFKSSTRELTSKVTSKQRRSGGFLSSMAERMGQRERVARYSCPTYSRGTVKKWLPL